MELTKNQLETVRFLILEKQVDIDMQVAKLEDRGNDYVADIKCLKNERNDLEDILAKVRTEKIKLEREA